MSIQDDIAAIAVQESTLTLPGFNPNIAWQIGTLLRDLAIARNLPLVIDVRRFGSPHQPLFYCALDGTSPDNARWVQRKVNVVARFHKSSYHVGRRSLWPAPGRLCHPWRRLSAQRRGRRHRGLRHRLRLAPEGRPQSRRRSALQHHRARQRSPEASALIGNTPRVSLRRLDCRRLRKNRPVRPIGGWIMGA